MAFLRDRSGGWSPVKIVAFVASLVPALWIAFQAAAGELGPRPVTEAIHQCGDWALRLILITLAITPASRLLRHPRLISARRTLGVASAAYAVAHLLLFVLDQKLDLLKVATEIVLRIYLMIGFMALAGLLVLAATSTDSAVRRLGPARWSALHRVVYVVALLAAVHFFMQSKLETYQPVLMSGFLIWLMAYRALWRRNVAVTPLHLVLLAFAVALVTAAGEALLYMLTSGVNGWRVLLAHLDIDMEVRPAWWVLVAGLMAAGIGFWRHKPAHQRASARRISSDALSGATQVQSGS